MLEESRLLILARAVTKLCRHDACSCLSVLVQVVVGFGWPYCALMSFLMVVELHNS